MSRSPDDVIAETKTCLSDLLNYLNGEFKFHQFLLFLIIDVNS